ncbi:GAF and ANTAR domain-containing protein [Pseudonocardia ailaonensis]|uniref:GAF and ANTAR domain-containing protein n=1 Tax=Pseudonocardia ailaonensis TaxID=367279 RepID=A0ABN2N9S0_9PSEU
MTEPDGPDSGVAAAAAHLAELARDMAVERDERLIVRSVVDAAVREVPGAEFAGITVIEQEGAWTPAATDDLVSKVDVLQYETGQGPCLEAADQARTVRSNDLTTDPRWPRFADTASQFGVRSVLAFPLFTEASTLGALNIYARSPHAFDTESERIGFLLAAHAAAAIVPTRNRAHLLIALDSRDLIGQAKGILMERYKIDAVRAFALLTTASQRFNVKLHAVARHLTDTGELVSRPDSPPD